MLSRVKSLSPQKMNISKQRRNNTNDGSELSQPQHRLFVQLGNQEVEINLPQDSTVSRLNSKVKEVAESLLAQPQQANSIVCLETVGENEVIDYYLTYPMKKISQIREDMILRPVFSQKINHQNNNSNQMDINDFKFVKCLGKGGTSDVFLVRHRESGKLFALKMIPKTHLSEYKRLEQLLRERKILIDAAKAPFIASLHACFESEQHLNFLLEFYCGGELFFHLQSQKLSCNEAKFYFVEILICFEYLHKNNILYRDLKPENIVLDMDGHVRLTDFGLAKIGMEKDEMTDSFCGSPEYMAPEVLSRKGYNYSVDFYTLGAFLFELVTGLPPFYADNTDTILANIQHCTLEVPQYLDEDLQDLLYALLDKRPQTRINSFDEIKSSKWFHDVNWKAILQQKVLPPIIIDINQSYIHSEFRSISLPKNIKSSSNESLFSFFNYVNPTSAKLFKNSNLEIEVEGDHPPSASISSVVSSIPSSSTGNRGDQLLLLPLGNPHQMNLAGNAKRIQQKKAHSSMQVLPPNTVPQQKLKQQSMIVQNNSYNRIEESHNNSNQENSRNIGSDIHSHLADLADDSIIDTQQSSKNLLHQYHPLVDHDEDPNRSGQHQNNGKIYFFTNNSSSNVLNASHNGSQPQKLGVHQEQLGVKDLQQQSSAQRSSFNMKSNTTVTTNNQISSKSSIASNLNYPQQFASQKRTNTESSASRVKAQGISSQQSTAKKSHSIKGNFDHSLQGRQQSSQKFLDMESLKTGFNTLNPLGKNKSVDSAALIKSFMKGQLSFSTKNLKQQMATPPLHTNHHQQTTTHAQQYHTLQHAPSVNGNINSGTHSNGNNSNTHSSGSHFYSNGNSNVPKNGDQKTQQQILNRLASSSQDRKRQMSPCYSPKNHLTATKRANTAQGMSHVKKQSSMIERREDSTSGGDSQASLWSLPNNNGQNSQNTSNIQQTKNLQKLGNSLQRQQQQNQHEGLSSSTKNLPSTAAKSSNSSNNTNTLLYPRSTLSSKENTYQLLGTNPANTGTAITTANLLQKKNLPYSSNLNTLSSANLLRSPATTATTVNSATSANSELLASTSAAAQNILQHYMTQQHDDQESPLEAHQLYNYQASQSNNYQHFRTSGNSTAVKSSAAKKSFQSKQKSNQNSRKSLEPSMKRLSINDNIYSTKNNFIKYFEDIAGGNANQGKKNSFSKSQKVPLKEISQTPSKPVDVQPSSTTNKTHTLHSNQS